MRLRKYLIKRKGFHYEKKSYIHFDYTCLVGFKECERVKGLLRCYDYQKESLDEFFKYGVSTPFHIRYRDIKYLKGFILMALRLFGSDCVFHTAPRGKYLPLLIEKNGLFVCIAPRLPDDINDIMFTKRLFKMYTGCKCPVVINRMKGDK